MSLAHRLKDQARREASTRGFPSVAPAIGRSEELLLVNPVAGEFRLSTARTKLYIRAAQSVQTSSFRSAA